jgi:hypothetical protein
LQVERRVVVLDRQQRLSHRKVGGIQKQALDATFSFVNLVDQQLRLNPFFMWDVEVHDILGGIFELAQLLL